MNIKYFKYIENNTSIYKTIHNIPHKSYKLI